MKKGLKINLPSEDQRWNARRQLGMRLLVGDERVLVEIPSGLPVL